MEDEHGPDCNCGGEEFKTWVEATATELLRLADGTEVEAAMIDAMRAKDLGEDPRMWKMAYFIKTAKHAEGMTIAMKEELITWGIVAQAVVRLIEERDEVEVTH